MEWGSSLTYLAQTTLKERTVVFGIKDLDRMDHICVIGRTGNDRASFLARLILEDFERGLGVVVIDTTGTLTRLVTERVRDEVKDKLIYLDPGDGEYPYSWNALDDYRALAPEIAKPLLSKAVASMYQIPVSRLTECAADAMLNTGSTMLTFFDLVVNDVIRAERFEGKDEARKAFEAALAENKESVEKLQEQGKYIGKDSLVRNLVGQQESKFTLEALNSGALIIVDFSRIKMFPTRMTPLVRILIHAVEARAHVYNEPIALYLNECLRYLAEGDIDLLFSKHAVTTTIADTFYGDEYREIREKAVSRSGSVIAFAPNQGDAATVERVFYPYITGEELEKIEENEFIIALTIDAVRSRPFFATVLPLPGRSGLSEQDLIGISRNRYTTPRLKVDHLFKSQPTQKEAPPQKESAPSTFTDTFRSIFAKRPDTVAPKDGDARASKPDSPSTSSKPKPDEIPEDELKSMLTVDEGRHSGAD